MNYITNLVNEGKNSKEIKIFQSHLDKFYFEWVHFLIRNGENKFMEV